MELGRLTNLEQLYLSGNRFTGCVPAELRGVRETDRTHLLKDIGIPYCDVLLSGLSITPATLTTQFGAYITAYTATASASRITVNPSNRHNATFQYLDGTDRALTDTDGAQSGHQIDLPTGTTSTIKVKVTSGDGVASRVYTIQVTGPGALGPPAIGSVTPGAGSLTVAWRAPSQTGGSAITAYDLRHIRSDAPNKGDANWTVAQNTWTGSGSLQYVAIGLTSGTQYDVQVRAVNAAGDGPWSATAVGTITSTAPGGPTGLTATATGQTQIDLSWSAPSQTGGSAITGYLIEVSEDNSNWSNLESDTDSTSTSYSHTGLTAGTTRYYRVSAINSAGTGPASNTATGLTAPAGTPGAPAISSVTPGAGSLTVAWSTPSQTGGSAITAYDLRHIRSDATSKGDANWTVAQDVWSGSGALSYELTGLDGGMQYDVQARAVNSTGDGPWSATVSGTPTSTESTPGSPANAQYRREGSTILVTWDPSAGATYYKVYYSDSRFLRCSLLSSGTSLGCEELAGNVAGTTYTHDSPDDDNNNYWITACNNAGCSDIDSANPAQFVDNRPVAPTNPQYSREGSTTVVTWDPAASAEYYKVYYDDFFGSSCRIGSGGSPSFCELLAGNVAGTTYTHTSPDDGANYYWITACNSAGCSDIDSANPAQFVASSPVATVPGAPNALTATANGQTQIDLSWSAPSSNGGADITGYRIEVSENGSTWTDLEASTGNAATSYSHTGLTAGSTRHYRVSAINSVGTSPASNTADATTGVAPAPDLAVETPTVDASAPAAGARFTLNATVRNQGSGASGSTTLRYYRSTDSTITAGDTEVGTDPVFRLGASASGDESISLTAPSTSGTYYYGACVDSVSDESDTTNNCSSAVAVAVGAAPTPDVVLSTPRVSASTPTAGASFILSVTAENQGSASSQPTTLRFYRSTDSTISSSDTQLGTHSVPILGPGGGFIANENPTAPSSPGTYYYGACVDSVSGESDTTNNCSPAVAVTVGAALAPDLVVDTPTVSESAPGAGASFTLNTTVRNPGSGASDSTTLRYYQSTDSTVTTGDTEVGTDSVSRLGVSASEDESISLAAPSTPGTYYYGACVDPVPGESDTTNNCSAAVTVIVGASASVPGAPTALTATADGQTEIDLSWTVPSDDDGADITGYRIEVSRDGSSWTDLVANTNSTSTSYSHTGLTAGSTKHYRVSAINSVGTGTASNTANATTDTQQDTSACATDGAVPDAANNPGLVSDCEALLDAKDTLRGTATLNWSAGASISQWDGITVGGTPRRVTKLDTSGAGLAELTGTIPLELGNLTSLTNLRLSNNQLTGPIPPELGRLSNLESLSLWGNELSGAIPEELGNLSNLTFLRLSGNQLAGSMPAELGNLTNLDFLSLGGNRLTGAIPPELGRLTNLLILDLGTAGSGGNRLTGTIPSELSNLTKLQSLNLWHNRLTGQIPTWLGNRTDLGVLILADNQLTGTIPTELGNLTKVSQLWLHNNQLTGTIPRELGNLTNVTELHLHTNRLTGEIPAELANLSGLRQLSLRDNRLTGCIPAGLRDVATQHDIGQLGLPDCTTATAPAAPMGLTATANGQTQIDLSWTAPSDNGGAAVTGYRIEVSADGSNWSDLEANTDSPSTTYSHTGLTAGSTRHYRVSAINSVGTGSASNVDNATTDLAPATDGTCTVDLIVRPGESCTYPGTSTEFSVDSDGNGQFLFTSSGSRIELRNTTINGLIYTFVASKQSDGNWLVEGVG